MELKMLVFSAWMQTNYLFGHSWKDLICSTGQYSASVKGSLAQQIFLLTHVSPPSTHPGHLQHSQVRTGCQPLPCKAFPLLQAIVESLATTSTESLTQGSYLPKINNKQGDRQPVCFATFLTAWGNADLLRKSDRYSENLSGERWGMSLRSLAAEASLTHTRLWKSSVRRMFSVSIQSRI